MSMSVDVVAFVFAVTAAGIAYTHIHSWANELFCHLAIF